MLNVLLEIIRRSLYLGKGIKVCCLFALLISFSPKLKAQYNLKENNIWVFGEYGGLDFNIIPPKPILTKMLSFEGCASVCDTNGQLLFYSSGDSVWNKSGHIMPNGYGLTSINGNNYSCYSSTQGALILPVLTNPNQFYLFSLEEDEEDSISSRLFLSIVDLSLNGGLGDVVSGKKSILIDSGLAEKMIAVPGNNCDLWLITIEKLTHRFKVHNIDGMGIHPNPVFSPKGNLSGWLAYDVGVMKISPDRSKLALASTYSVTQYASIDFNLNGMGAELYDFDANTGRISNCRTLIDSQTVYGVEFSPDNNKLYISYSDTDFYPSYVAQYDLTNNNLQAIKSSKFIVNANASDVRDMRLARDGKIYLANNASHDSLDIIDSPNLSGANCNYIVSGIGLAVNAVNGYGMPNLYVKSICPEGVAHISVSNFNIVPNPAHDEITLTTDGTSMLMRIYDVNGRMVQAQQLTQRSNKVIFNSKMSSGVYVVECEDKNGYRGKHRIVIER